MKCWARKNEPGKLLLRVSKNFEIAIDDALIGEAWLEKFLNGVFLTTGIFQSSFPDISRQTRERLREVMLQKMKDKRFLLESEFQPILKQLNSMGMVSRKRIREVPNFSFRDFLFSFLHI